MKKVIAAALIAAFSLSAVDSFAAPWHRHHHVVHHHMRHHHHRY